MRVRAVLVSLVFGIAIVTANPFFAVQKIPKQCLEEIKTGPCTGFIPMYGYDRWEQKCVEFIYGGCQGNANKFDSMEKCESVCKVKPSKPSQSKRCMEEIDSGPCMADILKYAYDKYAKKCIQFIYGGCQGNENRFNTREECERVCKAKPSWPAEPKHCYSRIDPGECMGYFPVYGFDVSKNACVQFVYGGCGGNGNRFDSREECERHCRPLTTTTPRSSLCCQDVIEPGHCNDYIPMYGYDKSKKRCVEFIYGGCGGNDNRFHTRDECERICDCITVLPMPVGPGPVIPPIPEGPGPVIPSGSCRKPIDYGTCASECVKYGYDSKLGECVKFMYGGADGTGNRFDTKKECEDVCTCTSPDKRRCKMPIDFGRCQTEDVVYGYDSRRHECVTFVYGGAGGNSNRFTSKRECERVCQAPTTTPVPPPRPSSCRKPIDYGSCSSECIAYGYDSRKGECVEFMYGGSKGNANRFDTKEECEDSCGCDYSKPDLCYEHIDFGQCTADRTLYGYDSKRNECIKFTYGGAGGNSNRFESRRECEKACEYRYS